MANLLKETIDFLSKNNRSPKDVLSIGAEKYRISWDTFAKHADIEYDNGFGGCEIIKNIKIYGKDFVAFRNEYDGSEWWQFISIPEDNKPNLDDNDNISFLANVEEENISDDEEEYVIDNEEEYITQVTCHNFDIFCEVEVLKSKTWKDFEIEDYLFSD